MKTWHWIAIGAVVLIAGYFVVRRSPVTTTVNETGTRTTTGGTIIPATFSFGGGHDYQTTTAPKVGSGSGSHGVSAGAPPLPNYTLSKPSIGTGAMAFGNKSLLGVKL